MSYRQKFEDNMKLIESSFMVEVERLQQIIQNDKIVNWEEKYIEQHQKINQLEVEYGKLCRKYMREFGGK